MLRFGLRTGFGQIGECVSEDIVVSTFELTKKMDNLVAKAHQLCFVNDIFEADHGTLVGKPVRVTGKLISYDPVLSRANIVHPIGKSASSLVVSSEHLAPASLIVGSLYQFLGELVDVSGVIMLCARTVRNVDGLDVEKFIQTVKLQQQYLAQRFP